MPSLKLTNKSVADARATDAPVIYRDTDLAGFALKVYPSNRSGAGPGKKTFIIEYRTPNGGRTAPKRRFKIGSVSDGMTADKARKTAADLLAGLRNGLDPLDARRLKQETIKAQRDALTVSQLLDKYLNKRGGRQLRVRTKYEYELLAKVHINPALGNVKIESLKKSQVQAFHENLESARYSANRAVTLLSAAFTWAQNKELISGLASNPCKGVERYEETKNERYLKADELSRLGEALRLAETIGLPWDVNEEGPNAKHLPPEDKRRTKIDPYAIAAIRLLLLTGARLREILHCRRSWVNISLGVINIPAGQHKGKGVKTIALSPAAQQVIANLPVLEGWDDWLVPGLKENQPRADLKKPWFSITRAAHLPDLKIHTLRHSFGAIGAGSGMGLPIIGKLLGHTNSSSVTERYSHVALDPMRRAVEIISTEIEAALEGRKLAVEGQVVSITEGRKRKCE